jgi:hypothetical protein
MRANSPRSLRASIQACPCTQAHLPLADPRTLAPSLPFRSLLLAWCNAQSYQAQHLVSLPCPCRPSALALGPQHYLNTTSGPSTLPSAQRIMLLHASSVLLHACSYTPAAPPGIRTTCRSSRFNRAISLWSACTTCRSRTLLDSRLFPQSALCCISSAFTLDLLHRPTRFHIQPHGSDAQAQAHAIITTSSAAIAPYFVQGCLPSPRVPTHTHAAPTLKIDRRIRPPTMLTALL